VAQLLELITTGTAARWRLNRLVADLSDVCGLGDPDALRRAMLGQKAPNAFAAGAAHGGDAAWSVGAWAQGAKGRLQRAATLGRAHAAKLGGSVAVLAAAACALGGRGSAHPAAAAGRNERRSRTTAAATAASSGGVAAAFGRSVALAVGLHVAVAVAYVLGAHLVLLGKPRRTAASGRRPPQRGAYDAPLCSFELWPLFCLARALSRAGAAVNGGGEEEVDLRWLADYRNWTFGALVGAALAHPAVRSAMLSWLGLVSGGLFALFQRYPHLWFKLSSGRWFNAGSGGDFD
jgi:hypothetical protein